MSGIKQLWLLTGGNGAGKTTFYNLFLARHGIRFVNADLIARELDVAGGPDVSYQAAAIATKIREELIAKGQSFCFETVFSHESKIDFIGQAKARGYSIILIYIHLSSPMLNEARVQQRVSTGGHDVPAEKIHSRIPRTMQNIATAITLVDEARFLDNSLHADPFRQVVVIKGGQYTQLVSPLPLWATKLVEGDKGDVV